MSGETERPGNYLSNLWSHSFFSKTSDSQLKKMDKITFIKIFAFILISGGLIAALLATILPPEEEENFELLCETKSLSGDVPVFKYKSLRTGLHVIIAKIQGPLVHGYFTLATEAQDDDGLPHTLEHLVFQSSEDYPFTGVLDLLANRCFADGTNAWTATDHTAYTVATAGKDGFLNLLPIFLDHILYPTLTNASFLTEIYHVNGKGQDAGVVYSEMQARENTGWMQIFNALFKILYPYPSGYRYETGGILTNLRNNITIEKIRKYFKAVYRPENLFIIITGDINPEEVFQAMTKIENKIVSKGDRGPFIKPWQTPVPPFSNSVSKSLVYPSDTEDNGIISVGWRGPELFTNTSEFQSLEVLLIYLTQNSVSPLPKAFVEIEDPLASYVSRGLLDFESSSIIISFGGVPLHKIERVYPLLMEILSKIASGNIPFDEKAMKNTLNNLILKEESKLETSPHSSIAYYVILDALYGRQCQDISKIINIKEWYETLLLKPSSYWIYLIKKYFIDVPSVVIKGSPSISEATRLQEEESNRVKKRKEELGEDGLKKLQNKLIQAEEINKIPPPNATLESVPVPSTTNIKFHSLKPYTNIEKHSSGSIPKSDPSLFDFRDVPVKMILNDINSNFVQLIGILDTQSLAPNDRFYLPILMELLLESPMRNGNNVIPYEEVIGNLHEDIISAYYINGIYGSFFHNVMINLKMEMKKYEKGVRWLSDILFNVIFDKDRISVKANKFLNSIGERKRSGYSIIWLLSNEVIFKNDTNIRKRNFLRQEKFLKKVVETLNSNPQKILDDLERIYKTITKLEDITILMATNLQKLSTLTDASKPWQGFAIGRGTSRRMTLRVVPDFEERLDFTSNSNVTGYLVGIKSLESGFLQQMTKSIMDPHDKDLAALLTAITYFNQKEGPMWKQIRGKGLAYSYRMSLHLPNGILYLHLFKANQIVEAYKEALKLINDYINGYAPWNQLLFESAKSALVYKTVQRESEISDVSSQALMSYYGKVPVDFNRSLLRAIDKVTLPDVARVSHKYLRSLINPKQSKTIIVCPSAKSSQIKNDFEMLHHSIDIVESIEESQFSNI